MKTVKTVGGLHNYLLTCETPVMEHTSPEHQEFLNQMFRVVPGRRYIVDPELGLPFISYVDSDKE